MVLWWCGLKLVVWQLCHQHADLSGVLPLSPNTYMALAFSQTWALKYQKKRFWFHTFQNLMNKLVYSQAERKSIEKLHDAIKITRPVHKVKHAFIVLENFVFTGVWKWWEGFGVCWAWSVRVKAVFVFPWVGRVWGRPVWCALTHWFRKGVWGSSHIHQKPWSLWMTHLAMVAHWKVTNPSSVQGYWIWTLILCLPHTADHHDEVECTKWIFLWTSEFMPTIRIH